MAKIDVNSQSVYDGINGIRSCLADFKDIGSKVRNQMTTLNCWQGEDKTIFCSNVDGQLMLIDSLTAKIEEYNEAAEKCMDKYADCEDATVAKLNTVL